MCNITITLNIITYFLLCLSLISILVLNTYELIQKHKVYIKLEKAIKSENETNIQR